VAALPLTHRADSLLPPLPGRSPQGGRAYHEKIGGGNIAGPETWPLLDDSVQDAFVAGGRFFVVKNGQLWHEKLGGGDIVGPETRGYLDWAVTACWEQDGRAYFVRGGKVEHFALPFLTETPEAETLDQLTAGWHSHTLANKRKGDAGKSKAGPAKLLKTLPHDPTCVKLGDIQAMWTLRDRLYMVSGGKVYHQPIGGGAQSGPESWDIIDDTVQAAYVADERLYVIKGGKVFHAAASQAAAAGAEIVGPEAWPLVDGEVQAALVTTDAKLGIARYVTVRRSRGPTPPPDDSVTLPLPTCLPAATTHFIEKHHHGFGSPPATKDTLYV